ncbi:MAG: diphthine--ammonia ligase [Candidatus Pacearchaeota archaeon]
MKLAALFSGGKDSTYATYLAIKEGYEVSCLITIFSENKESYMFHTPSISQVKRQAESMNIPLIAVKTKGEKEKELTDLKRAIKLAIKNFNINGIITGAIDSVYQSSRIQRICNELNIECFNPLWQKNQFELINELITNEFEVVITGVFAYPLTKDFIGRKIDYEFLDEIVVLNKKFNISLSGEGGEFESFVINCPLFKNKLEIKNIDVRGDKYSWIGEIILK